MYACSWGSAQADQNKKLGWVGGSDGGVGGNPTDAAALSKRRQKMGS